jgi:fucose 4-O-acetylase-like acetyltransferase
VYSCVDAISSRIFNGKFRYIINGVTAIILLLVSKLTFIPTTFNFPAACGAFILYYFGVMYRRYELNNLLNKKLVPISIITFFISALIGNTFMVGISGSINPLMDFISMLVSLIMVLAVSQIRPISNISILKFFGKCSLEIMALHMFSFKAISLIMIKFYGYDISLLSDIPVIRLSNLSLLWYILYTSAGLFLPAAFYLVKAKVKSKISH